MIEIFESRKLVQAVNDVKPAPSFIIDKFFRNKDVNTAEYIDVTIYDGKRKLAPFVSPRVGGVLMESKGKTVSSYKPAYIKFKYGTEADAVARDTSGVFYADNKTPAQRGVEKAVIELEDGKNSITRRIETMAVEAVTSGTCTIVGDGIDDVIDFQMPPANIITLTGTDLWTDANSDPIADVNKWKRQVVKSGGVMPDTMVLGGDVLEAFIANEKVQNYLDTRRIELGNVKPTDLGEGVTAWGTILALDIYSYDGYYTDKGGATKNVFPVDKVLLGSTMAKTVLNYGAIKDFKAGSFVGEVFAKSWEIEDPSMRYVLLQSAPLPVPTQIGAFLTAKAV